MKLRNLLVMISALCFVVMAKADLTNKDAAAPEWIKKTQPGENHKMLKDYVGTWKATVKFWEKADSKAEESKGTNKNKLVMGGRFLQSDFTGKAMGQPFTGMGLLGYDNVRGEYQSIWIDSMSTHLMAATGTFDPATKTLQETGTASCPMTNDKNKWYRSEVKMIDAKKYTYEMYAKADDGKEFRTMEIIYTK